MVKANLAENREDFGAINPSEIRSQLDRILASSDFDVPSRVRRFLDYVVTEALSGRASRIKAYSIAVEVFGRDATFDPQSDPVVRMEAGRVRRALERYYLTAGSSDPIVITIPKGGYVPVFSRPRSVQPKHPLARDTSHRRGWQRMALWAFAAFVLVVSAWAISQRIVPRNTANSSPDSAASGPAIPKLLVEPFQDETGTAEGATIAKGLTEEMVGKLASFRDLTVVLLDPSRPDSATLTAAIDPAMRYMLSGGMRLDGDAISLSTRLIDRGNGSVLWAKNYDGSRSVHNVLELESDIAGDIARALGQPYGIIFQADASRTPVDPPEDWAAYACTLAYYSYRTVLDQPAHDAVKQCLEQAVQRFPGYATAWALLSLMYIDENRFRYRTGTTAPASLEEAIAAARRAVTLDPNNTRALEAEMLGLFFDNDADAALQVGKRAMALNPNDSEIVGEYGLRLALSGDWAHGCPLIAEAAYRNPAPLGYDDLALALCSYMQGDYQKALSWIRKAAIETNPVYHFVAAAIYGQLGDTAAAERERQWVLDHASGLLQDIRSELQTRIKSPRDQAHFLDGLRRAGFSLPES